MKARNIILSLFLLVNISILYGAEPTTQSSSISVAVSKCDEVTLNWTNGDGAWRMMLIREGAPVDDVPADGTTYISNSTYGAGADINGNYIISNNITNSATIKGLKQNTTYHVAIFEHDGGSPDYLTTNPATFSFTTENISFDAYFEYTDSCQNTNVFEFKNKTTSTFGGVNYRWELGDGTIINGDTASHTYVKGGTYTVVLRVLNPRGCKSAYTLPKKVFCVPRPRSKVKEENDDTIQCFDDHLFTMTDKNLTAIDNVQNASFRRTWYFPDNTSLTDSRIQKSFPTAGQKKILYVSVTDLNGVPTACTDSLWFDLLVVENPGNNISKGDTVQCLANNQFTFENTAGNLTYTYWAFGDGNTAGTSQANHVYSDTGLYSVRHRATTREGCSSSDTFPVRVKPNKNASFTINQPIFCLNQGPAKFFPTDTSGTFYGLNVVNREMLFTDTGIQNVIHIVDDTICPDTVRTSFRVKPIPQFSLLDSNICGGGSITYTVNAGTSVLWDNGSTSRQRQFSNTGNYWAVATQDGCSYSDTFSLYVGAPPVIGFPSDTLMCDGQSLLLKLSASEGTIFAWSDGSRDSFKVISKATSVSLTATNGCGSSTKSIVVRYLKDNCDLFVPNVFSPNQTGPNEIFTYVEKNQINVEAFQVFNRWGHKVYDFANERTPGWDGNFEGKPCPDGVYVYRILYNTGSNQNLQINVVEGVVHLIR